jgi:hypothetical protein
MSCDTNSQCVPGRNSACAYPRELPTQSSQTSAPFLTTTGGGCLYSATGESICGQERMATLEAQRMMDEARLLKQRQNPCASCVQPPRMPMTVHYTSPGAYDLDATIKLG